MLQNILIGAPGGYENGEFNVVTVLLQYVMKGYGIDIASDPNTFRMALESGAYDCVICMEDPLKQTQKLLETEETFIETNSPETDLSPIEIAYDATSMVIDYGLNQIDCIVVLANRTKGNDICMRYVNEGIKKIIFTRDVTPDELLRLLGDYERTERELLEYLDVYLPPAVIEPVEDERIEYGSSNDLWIQREHTDYGFVKVRFTEKNLKRYLKQKEQKKSRNNFLSSEVELKHTAEQMPYMEFPMDEQWVLSALEAIRKYYKEYGIMTLMSFKNDKMPREKFENHVITELMRMKLSKEQAKIVCSSFMRDIDSYGRLDALLNATDVSDVRLMNKDTVTVQYRGQWYKTNITFETKEAYEFFILRMCSNKGAALNMSTPQVIFTDLKTFSNLTLRITATHPVLSSEENYSAHIRIATKNKKTIETLVEDHFMTEAQARVILNGISTLQSMIICGGSGSGKSLLLNASIEYFDVSICGECIQESDELHSKTHPNIEFLHSLAANKPGETSQTLEMLAAKALTKNAAVFIIGEIKGDEAKDFVDASRTCKVFCTTHAEDCTGGILRVSELAAKKMNKASEIIKESFYNQVNLVIYCEKYRCKQIAEVVDYDKATQEIIYDLYEFEEREDGR